MYKRKVSNNTGIFFHHVVSIKLKVFLENDRITIILEYHEFLYCQRKKVVLRSRDK